MFPLAMGIISGMRRNVGENSNENRGDAFTQAQLKVYVAQSPLLGPCGLTPEAVSADIETWQRKGEEIARNLGLSTSQLTDPQKRRIYQYYLPVYFWCRAQLARHRASGERGPLIIGISAPQGCGKSTLCEQLEALLTSDGLTAAAVSTDDFYLTHEDQRALAASHPGNPLLEMRGNFGSHDLDLGSDTLAALWAATKPSSVVALPRYDKSAYQGRGDRAPRDTWPKVTGPVDVVLFEGWSLGFSPVGNDAAAAVDPNLVPVDAALRKYRNAWDAAVNAWLVVRVDDPQYAYRWRLQAELAMRASGRPAMTDEQVAAFVDRFMPAYKAYLPGLYKNGPTTAAPGRLLVVLVNENREPVNPQPEPIM